jgi:hypothetical protein
VFEKFNHFREPPLDPSGLDSSFLVSFLKVRRVLKFFWSVDGGVNICLRVHLEPFFDHFLGSTKLVEIVMADGDFHGPSLSGKMENVKEGREVINKMKELKNEEMKEWKQTTSF